MPAPLPAARQGNPCVFGTVPQHQPAGKPLTPCKAQPKPAFQAASPQSKLKSVLGGGKQATPKAPLKVAVDPKPAKVGNGTVVFSADKLKATPPPAKPINAHNPKARKVVGNFGAIGLLKDMNKGTGPKRASGAPSRAAGPQKK